MKSHLLLLIGSLGLAVGCSTIPPMESGHLGLLDSLAKMDATYRISNTGRLTPDRVRFIRQTASNWRWPLSSITVTSPFGARSRGYHEGVDLRARSGTPVHAVSAGVVVYAGSGIRGYGRLVVIKHDSGLTSLYAHNSRILVKRGERVNLGDKISLSGRSGRATGPHLHFEVRDGVTPVDPTQILPTSGPGWKLAIAKH